MRYEYKSFVCEYDHVEARVNTWATDGWDLFSTFPVPTHHPGKWANQGMGKSDCHVVMSRGVVKV